MRIVAGLSLKGLEPRVWNPESPYYIPQLQAVMVSYADFHAVPKRRRNAMNQGLHAHLGIPEHIDIYLDNGAFYFLNHQGETPRTEYEEFVQYAQPSWKPIPQDYIPVPSMTYEEQRSCFYRTVQTNYAYQHNGYSPVIHIGQFLEKYLSTILINHQLVSKTTLALGGIVPNLLRTPKAMPYKAILKSLKRVRESFIDKHIHVFGIGGTATLHLAALVGIDSVDSSGWRNRAARGMIQLPGSGERVVAELGSWRGRRLSEEERIRLSQCHCPACRRHGSDGLIAEKAEGFRNRATHNLWVLLEESRLIQEHLTRGTYTMWYQDHLDNTIYRPLIDYVVSLSLTPLDDGLYQLPPMLGAGSGYHNGQSE